jgi:carboxyl-terminal processing protease
MPRFRTAAVGGALLLPLIGSGFMLQSRGTREGARLFDQVLTLVSDRFVDTVTTGDLYEKAARGLVHELQDPYSELLTPKQLQGFNTNTAGRYGGIGMQIEDQNGLITVSRVFPNTPAERAGIREGDRIIGIDTASTRGWKIRQVSDVLQGTPGTQVKVRFSRPGVADPIIVDFTRAIIHIPAVPYSLIFDGGSGYIPVQQFSENVTEELAREIQKLTASGAKGLILDLRGNPGGFLDQALSVSNLFLKQGTEIASVRGRNMEPQTYMARGRPTVPDLPMIILTDGYSASASEIVAGALQDHDRALIIGTTSFGKGLVQTVFNLDGGYALKLTTAKWFTPSGRSIQKERVLQADGSFVESHPDSLEADSVRKARPIFRSDAGRVVYGGGAITPDRIVKPDTLTAAEQAVVRAIAPKSQEVYVALYDFAFGLKNQVKPNFEVQQAWRDEFYRRITATGAKVDRAQYDKSTRYIDRLIENRVARLAFGDSAAKRRDLDDDVQLRTALDILRKGQSQRDLFAMAGTPLPQGRNQ